MDNATKDPNSTAPTLSLKPQRTMFQRVVSATFAAVGARFGLMWIGVLLIFSVFSPFIANSHPLLLKIDGEWSSPLMQHLTGADVGMLLAFFTGLVLYFLKSISRSNRFWIWLGISTVGWAVASLTVTPPDVVVYKKYRVMETSGEAEFMLRVPIPYSPNDRRGDRGDLRPIAPWWSLRFGEPEVVESLNNKIDLYESKLKTATAGNGDKSADPDEVASLERTLTLLREQVPLAKEEGEAEIEDWVSQQYWLGQDGDHQCVASRMIHASRIALAIGFIATGIAGTIGIIIGGLMGYFAGVVDLIGMRLVEIFEFIPQLFLLLMFVAFFDRNIYMIMVIIGLTSWSSYARFIRAEFLKLRNQDFVQAAKAVGLPLRSILFRHMLPNGLAPVLVRASFGVAGAILSEAVLSFLGLGLIEEPSWGQLLNQAARGGKFVWWIAIFPGLAIFMTVFAYNLIGEALRDAIDPHTSRNSQA